MNRKKYYNMSTKILIIIPLILLFQNNFGQNRSTPATYGMGVTIGPSLTIYDTKTIKYINNPMTISYDLYLFYRNINLAWGECLSYTYNHYVTKDIIYHDKKLTNNQRLRLAFKSIKLGYSFKLKNNYTIDPYVGYHVYGVYDYEIDNKGLIGVEGYCFSVEISKWFLRDRTIRIFIKNQFNVTHLSWVNDNLGNFANVFEIGFGGRFGKLK
jgi:hypothetical protein